MLKQKDSPQTIALPRLRDDLRIMPFTDADGDGYVLEDPLRNTYYKIGAKEYNFLCYLEQDRGFDGIASGVEEDGDVVTMPEAKTILNWLASKQLLQKIGHDALKAIEEDQLKAQSKSWVNRLNVMIFKVPLFNPDPLLTILMPWVGWLAGPIVFGAWGLLAIWAMTVLFTNWGEFVSQSVVFFSPVNMLFIGLAWVCLKLLHESAHAITCRRYGGRVYEAGVLFILFFPLTYINATSSWSFSNRWQRIHVVAAGVMAELFVAWLAIIYWSEHLGTVAGLLAHHLVIIAGISSLVFNANPLMRFDGYYVLSDLVSLPNLYFLGLDAIRKSGRKWWFGVSEPNSPAPGIWVWMYGLGVYLWRFLVFASLSILAAMMLSGWGIVLVAFALIGWVYLPIVSLLKNIPLYRQRNPRLISHFLMRLAIVCVAGGICLFGIRYQNNILAPAVIIYEKQYTVRTQASGFVVEITAGEGEAVQTGQKLFVLENIEIENSLKEVELEVAKIDLQERSAYADDNQGLLQVLEQKKAALVEQREALRTDLEAMAIYSPGDGILVKRHLKQLEGAWAGRGKELCQIVNPEHTFLVASIDQNDITSFPMQKGNEIIVDMDSAGVGQFKGEVLRISPRATKKLEHFSFAAPFGGTLDVKNSSDEGLEQRSMYELLTPRISIYLSLPAEIRPYLRDGQRGYLRVSGTKVSLGDLLLKKAAQWVENKGALGKQAS